MPRPSSRSSSAASVYAILATLSMKVGVRCSGLSQHSSACSHVATSASPKLDPRGLFGSGSSGAATLPTYDGSTIHRSLSHTASGSTSSARRSVSIPRAL